MTFTWFLIGVSCFCSGYVLSSLIKDTDTSIVACIATVSWHVIALEILLTVFKQ